MRTGKVQPGSCETCTRAVYTFESFDKSQVYLSYEDNDSIERSHIMGIERTCSPYVELVLKKVRKQHVSDLVI